MQQLIKPLIAIFAVTTLLSCGKKNVDPDTPQATSSNKIEDLKGTSFLNGTEVRTNRSNSSNTVTVDSNTITNFEVLCTPQTDSTLTLEHTKDSTNKFLVSRLLKIVALTDSSCNTCLSLRHVDSHGSTYYVTELTYNTSSKRIHSLVFKSAFGGSGGSSSTHTVLKE